MSTITIKNSIIATLTFFEVLGRPIHIKELHNLLWRKKITKEKLEKTLGTIPEIIGKDGYLFLNNNFKLIAKHKQRQKTLIKFWQKTKRFLKYLEYCPFVKMVAVGNTLAFKTAEEESDIDLLIILDDKRFWLGRLFITGLLHILGVRRHHQKIAGRFCLSFFLSEKALDIKKLAFQNDDIYLLYWIATLEPVINKSLYKRFIQKNKQWLNTYLPNWQILYSPPHLIKKPWCAEIINKILTRLLSGHFGNYLEKIVKRYLKYRALNKASELGLKANVIINDKVLKFHNIDRREDLFKKWKQLLDLSLNT